MGTDMTLCVEHRESASWTRVEAQRPTLFGDLERDNWYSERNYLLFGLLAGIRDTHLPPITPARGLPDDASDETRSAMQAQQPDVYGATWYTALELLSVDWWQPVEVQAWLTPLADDTDMAAAIDAVRRYDRPPNNWRLDIGEPGLGGPVDVETFRWARPLAHYLGEFPKIVARIAHVDPDDLSATRAVMWFDQWQ